MSKYIVMFDGETRNFYVGNGQTLTMKRGTIIDGDHVIAKRFKSVCFPITEESNVEAQEEVATVVEEPETEVVEPKEELLLEEPIEVATVVEEPEADVETEEVEQAEEVSPEPQTTVMDEIDACEDKDALETLIKERFDVDIDKRKSLKTLKAIAKEIAGE